MTYSDRKSEKNRQEAKAVSGFSLKLKLRVSQSKPNHCGVHQFNKLNTTCRLNIFYRPLIGSAQLFQSNR